MAVFVSSIKEPLHKSSTHVLAHARWVRQHSSPCSNLTSVRTLPQKTRKREFLEQMHQVVPWQELGNLCISQK